YVDGNRTELAGVTCAPAAATTTFACTAPLPKLSSGSHALEIASFVTEGALLESARSAALRVNVVTQTTAATAPVVRGGLGVSDTLGDPAVLLDQIPASRTPSAALRAGPDGMLYAAFDDGDEPRRRLDAGSYNGKVLRLTTNGTTPADATGATPVYAAGYGSP